MPDIQAQFNFLKQSMQSAVNCLESRLEDKAVSQELNIWDVKARSHVEENFGCTDKL